MKTKLNEEIGRRLKWLAFFEGITTRKLATVLNVTPSTLYYIMNGRVPLSLDKAAKLATYFKVSLDDLLGDGTLIPIYFRHKSGMSKEAACAEFLEKVDIYLHAQESAAASKEANA
ncbi:MAG: helix-turn-helix transcriptional regulator [Coprothermobacterota bacterium]|nr:helix-turn-helix transcriptional regulator [Coprothermobacterota bacterium]